MSFARIGFECMEFGRNVTYLTNLWWALICGVPCVAPTEHQIHLHDDVKPLLLHGKVRTQLCLHTFGGPLIQFWFGFYSKWIGAKCVSFQLIIIKLFIFHIISRIAYE